MTDWKGINHLALVTGDMDATVRFYRDTLGMPLVATIGTREGQTPWRHYFFKLSDGNTIAFFEWPGVKGVHKPAGEPVTGNVQFDHLSFGVENEAALLDLQKRLRAEGIRVTRVVDHVFIRSIYFTDPNGIALEASYWIKDATLGEPDYSDRMLFADPNPVSSVKERLPREAPTRR
ncbi:MAG: VOC family protein [Chloroflexi bacterium]|nr:VOC family protein [Chloroflexota bacterium]